MNISFNKISFKAIEKKDTKENKKSHKSISNPIDISSFPKIRNGAIAALFLLPTLGIVKTCNNGIQNANPNEIIIVDAPADTTYRSDYTDKTDRTFYKVKSGDSPYSIAKKHNISLRRLLAANGMNKTDIIHPDETLLIPESYRVKNINTLEDISKMSGLSMDYLKFLCDIEEKHNTVYKDRNNNETIGIGHLLTKEEKEIYKNKTISDKQIYTLLAQDILNTDLDLQTVINKTAYNSMPLHLKESVTDLAFNKGTGAIADNKHLCKALNEQDYVSAAANLTQDYSVVTNAKGEKIHKPAAGLSKRRLYNIANANEIFKNGMPDIVADSANAVYKRGRQYLEAEKNRGEISNDTYENVLSEYENIVSKLFDGKLNGKTVQKAEQITAAKNIKKVENTKVDNSQKIYVNGEKTDWTINSLYKDWEQTAKRQLRYVKRPLPQIDKNGNIQAYVKIIEPAAEGKLTGKTIIINPGHGGAMNKKEANGKINVNFDPGTSNAVMSKKNPNIETNNFIGNGGKSLEEWVVNQRIAEELAKKITNQGGKVIYVQGSVYSAMDAIRDIQKKNKVNLIVSLHSNSDGSKRGIYVISNKRGGLEDKKDKEFASTVVESLNKHSWFRGITHQKSQSLGVLSSSASTSSPVPGILIETGNLKNEDDVANLNSRNFKNQLIESILTGIIEYRD